MENNDWLVQRLRPRRPRFYPSPRNNQSNNEVSDLWIIEYLESVWYSEQDNAFWDVLVEWLVVEDNDDDTTDANTTTTTAQQPRIANLPWNIQWRLWLMEQTHKKASKAKDSTASSHSQHSLLPTNILPMIVSQLQSQLLWMDKHNHKSSTKNHNRPSTAAETTTATSTTKDLMDITTMNNSHNTTTNGSSIDNSSSCWKRDKLLLGWNHHQRFHVLFDLQQTNIWANLSALEQRCVQDIFHAMDSLSGYHHCHDDAAVQKHPLTTKSLALNVVESFRRDQQQQNEDQQQQQPSYKHEAMTTPSKSSRRALDSSFAFRQWIASSEQLQDDRFQREASLRTLCHNVGREGTRGKAYQKLADCLLQSSPSSQEMQTLEERRICLVSQHAWLSTIPPKQQDQQYNNDHALIRGKALCLYLIRQSSSPENSDNSPHSNNGKASSALVTLPRPDGSNGNINAFRNAVEHNLWIQPRQTGQTPNVEALLTCLWNHCVSLSANTEGGDGVNNASSVAVQVVQDVCEWLPWQPLVPLYRFKLQELLRITSSSSSAAAPDWYGEENAANAWNTGLAGTRDEQDKFEYVLQQHCSILRRMTQLVLVCCHQCTESIQTFWSLVFDDTGVIYQTILPIYFWQSLLLMDSSSTASRKVPCKDAMRAIRYLDCLLEYIDGQTPNGLEGLIKAVPMLATLLRLFVDLEEYAKTSKIASLQQQEVSDVPNNCLCFSWIGERIPKDSTPQSKATTLPLIMFCRSLMTFCQKFKHAPSGQWSAYIVSILQQQWGDPNEDEVRQALISTLICQLCDQQNVGRDLSIMTQKVYERLMTEFFERRTCTPCFFERIASEFDKLEKREAKRDILGSIFWLSPLGCVFAGCNYVELKFSLTRALSLCNRLLPSPGTIQRILVAAALQVGKLGNTTFPSGNQDTSGGLLSACKSMVVDFFKENIKSSRLSFGDFTTLQASVCTSIESRHQSERGGLAWWEEVSVEIQDAWKESSEDINVVLQGGKTPKASASGKKSIAPTDLVRRRAIKGNTSRAIGENGEAVRGNTAILAGALRGFELPSKRQKGADTTMGNESFHPPSEVDDFMPSNNNDDSEGFLSAQESNDDDDDDISDEILLLDLG